MEKNRPRQSPTPFASGYRPMGDVLIPSPEDPVLIERLGSMTNMDFTVGPEVDLEAVKAYKQRTPKPVTQTEIAEDALRRSQLGIPDIPLDLLRYGTPKQTKPTESYGINRGGSGQAGRKKSQFDVGPQFLDDIPGLEPLEMSASDMSDKPWELDEQSKADVAPGTSTTIKPEQNVIDKEPDLESPQGLYKALSQRYPEILTRNLDELEENRVTREELDQLGDRAGLGSLFIAMSKAASGAGSIAGKTAESIAPTIVEREDRIARQRLKDRMDVASENMAMNAKAVDLAIKQINFADEREQYDPNSEVSQFARDFMRDEFQVDVPATVPAYQLKQFLPAIVQKYQAIETGAYRNAMLQAQTTEKEAQRQMTRTEREAQRTFQETQNKLNRDLKRDLLREKQKNMPAPTVKQTPQDKISDKLIEKDAEKYQKRLQGLQAIDGFFKTITPQSDEKDVVQLGQSMLKTLNDTENSDAVGAEEARRLANELEMFTLQSASGFPRIGRDIPGFLNRVKLLRQRLYNTSDLLFQKIQRKMPGLVEAPPTMDDELSTQEIERLKLLRSKKK